MRAKKTRLGPNTEMIDRGMMTAIGQTKIDVMIIEEMIDMMMTDTMIIVGIIVIEIIHQETIGDHTRVTDIMVGHDDR